MKTSIKSMLVANRGEIAIRAMRAAAELGIRNVAIYATEDRLALHRFKADESYLVGEGLRPIEAYLDIDDILGIALREGVDAIHPGYGFLSENPDFAQSCADVGIAFIGPRPEVMRDLGNKVAARTLAERLGVPVVPATGALPDDKSECQRLAREIGYPLMLKASWGGGGRGMRAIHEEDELLPAIAAARREATAAFGNGEVSLHQRTKHRLVGLNHCVDEIHRSSQARAPSQVFVINQPERHRGHALWSCDLPKSRISLAGKTWQDSTT